MPRKKDPNKNYFNEDVENAIHSFNIETDDRERNKLFTIIYPALFKVAEVWYNKIKPTYVNLPSEEMMNDCVAFLLEKLPMIKEGKGKAFSYLTVTARNYYIMNNQIAYRKRLRTTSIEELSEQWDVEEVVTDRVQEMEWSAKVFEQFIEYLNDNFDEMFVRDQQKVFARALLEKVKEYGIGVEFNRRNMLNELAKETGIERGIVTKHVNRIASYYATFIEYFEEYGVKPTFKEKIYISEADEEYIRKNYRHYSKRNGLNGISRKLGIRYDILKKWVKETI